MLRTPAEIMGEHASDEWTAHDWQCVHDAIKAAQEEAHEQGYREGVVAAANVTDYNFNTEPRLIAKEIRNLIKQDLRP